MRILILGAGKMGSFFTDVLSFDHDCAVYEIDARRMRFLYHTQRFTSMEEMPKQASSCRSPWAMRVRTRPLETVTSR